MSGLYRSAALLRARRASPSLICAALVACAGSSHPKPTTPPATLVAAEALYDSAAEWAAAREPAPPRPQLRRRAAPEPTWEEPDYELRAFTLQEERRIARVQSFVRDASRTHAVPADMVNGIIWVESKFQVHAQSHKGPRGLMQLMPRTAREVALALGRRCKLDDPEFNIHAGTYYFARMVERFQGNLRLALAAYNIGPGVVNTWLRESEPLPGHSRVYVENVLTAARAFRARDPSWLAAHKQQVEEALVATVGGDPGERREQGVRGL